MRYLLGFLLLLLALGALRAALMLFERAPSQPRQLWTCQCGNNNLALAEFLRGRELRNHVATDSFYFYCYAERWPALLWNGKLLASAPSAGAFEGQDPGLPILPAEKAKLTTIRFHDSPQSGDWNVYLSPAKHNREEFDAIAACIQKNRLALQSAMDQPVKYWWSKTSFPMEPRAKLLASLSWGELPQTIVFTTNRPFSLPPCPGEKPFPESLHIRPDGQWDIALGEYRGMVKGQLLPVGPAFRFQTTQGPNPHKPVMDDPDYLAAWRSPDGKPLSAYVPLARN